MVNTSGLWTYFPVEELRLLVATVVVFLVFFSALGILWCLKTFGGELEANLSGNVGKGRFRLAVSGRGLIGCYLAIVAVEFAALCTIGWRFMR